ncbi:hypothetical protein ASU33_20275 [Solirubrum puertoriconensis]|uniref:Uncharacterized protein n=1 Tax=Solirubrum puertoriconensis TaxID=1751427 RepID=A0A9X0L5X6_SOLP1|nr:hypothetical protein ASU33_20275 [Solirubrum puertoriconensis]
MLSISAAGAWPRFARLLTWPVGFFWPHCAGLSLVNFCAALAAGQRAPGVRIFRPACTASPPADFYLDDYPASAADPVHQLLLPEVSLTTLTPAEVELRSTLAFTAVRRPNPGIQVEQL